MLTELRGAIRTGRLANGLQYAIWPDARDVVATLQIWVSVGSRDEQPGKTGLAHMLEHLMFRGTESVPDGEFDRRLESMGAQINAATWLDYTYYTATVHAGALPQVLELEADRFARLAITPAVFATEREVVANERRQVVDSDPESRLVEQFYRLAYGDSCYGWPTIGWGPDIAGYRREDVTAFYESAYAPERLLVAVAGAVDPAETLGWIEQTFGRLAARGTPRQARHAVVERGFAETVRLPMSTPRMIVAWPTGGRTAPDFAAWCLLHDLLGGGESALLPARLEIQDKVALETNASLYDHALSSLFEITVTLRSGAAPAAVSAAIDDVLARLAEEGPSDDEWETARTRIRTQDALSLATTYSRAEELGESWIAFGDPVRGLGLPEAVQRVSRAEIQQLATSLRTTLPRLELVGLPEEEP